MCRVYHQFTTPQVLPYFVLLVCWHLWNNRNDVVFDPAPPSSTQFWISCSEDAHLWSNRWPVEDRLLAYSWCKLLIPM
jgi:hypothetical protein